LDDDEDDYLDSREAITKAFISVANAIVSFDPTQITHFAMSMYPSGCLHAQDIKLE
jgi:hypothetical protein